MNGWLEVSFPLLFVLFIRFEFLSNGRTKLQDSENVSYVVNNVLLK